LHSPSRAFAQFTLSARETFVRGAPRVSAKSPRRRRADKPTWVVRTKATTIRVGNGQRTHVGCTHEVDDEPAPATSRQTHVSCTHEVDDEPASATGSEPTWVVRTRSTRRAGTDTYSPLPRALLATPDQRAAGSIEWREQEEATWPAEEGRALARRAPSAQAT
jgi:hypothetical protein